MSRSRVVFALGVVVPLLVLGGCSDDDPEVNVAPSESSSPTGAPTESSSPTGPVEPTMPAAANGNGAKGARAFVHFWLATLNYAIETGDTTSLESKSAKQCQECSNVVKTIDDIYSQGGELSGGTWTLKSLRDLPLDRGADWAGYVTATISAQQVRGVEGEEDVTYDPGPGFMYTYASEVDGTWQMVWMHIAI